MSAHSRLPPSGAHAWGACNAWVQMGERFPPLAVDPSAAEGEAAHLVAYGAFHGYPPLSNVAPNGVVVTDEMIEGADLYVRTIERLAGPYRDAVNLETRRPIHLIHREMFGTCDADMWLPDVTHLVDYKFGHLEVDPYRNPQLVSYLMGMIQERGLHPGHIAERRVVFHIVQPRAFHSSGPVRSWETTVGECWEIALELSAAAERALSENPPYAVGPQCTYCPARRACPALRRNSGAAMDYAATAMPAEMDGIALGIELRNAERMLAMLEARVEAMREQAEVALRKGETVLHHMMKAGRGAVIWSTSEAQVLALGRLLKADLSKPESPVTPTQAKDIFNKSNLDAAVIDGYSRRIPGAMKLAAVDDTTAAKVFTQ